MVRVAGLRGQQRADVTTISDDGLTPSEQLEQISVEVSKLQSEQQARFRQLRSELADEGIFIVEAQNMSQAETDWLEEYFLQHIFPVLTPLAIDPAHPFPFIPNLASR